MDMEDSILDMMDQLDSWSTLDHGRVCIKVPQEVAESKHPISESIRDAKQHHYANPSRHSRAMPRLLAVNPNNPLIHVQNVAQKKANRHEGPDPDEMLKVRVAIAVLISTPPTVFLQTTPRSRRFSSTRGKDYSSSR